MIFSRKRNTSQSLNIRIKDNPIEIVNSTKFLGVYIDDKLNWNIPIDYICKKLSKCIGILCKARRVLDKKCLLNIYYAFAYPYFTYCIHVWGNTYATYLNRLIKIQKKMIRIITSSSFLSNTAPLFR